VRLCSGAVSGQGWRCVVFDLDGTIVNTIPLIMASYDHALASVLGIHPDPLESRGWIGETLKGTFGRLYPEQASALVAAYLEFNMARLPKLLEQYPGMRELLGEVRGSGINTGVATSKRRLSAELTLTSAGLDAVVPLTVNMDDTATHKPDPAPLRLALDRLGAKASESVYVGDAVVDVQAAKAAGMSSIAVTWGAGLRDQLIAAEPNYLVDSVAQLRELLLHD
jgi:pyrophosphatase PpaX